MKLFNSIELLREMLSFIKNESGRAEAEQNKHDDRVMAMAIAHYIRPQQDMVIKEEKQQTEEIEKREKSRSKYINYGMW